MTATAATKGSRKRALIRKVAYQCFRDRGYHETTVDAVCEAAGISKGSFYWHYPSKQDVFLDILETWALEVVDALYEQFEDAVVDDDYRAAVTAALQREIHRGRAIIPLWLEFAAHARRDRAVQAALAKFFTRSRAAIIEILRPALSDRLGEADMRGVAAVVFGGYIGLLIQDLSDSDQVDAMQAAASFMTLLSVMVGKDTSA